MTQQTDHVPDGRKKGVTAVEWLVINYLGLHNEYNTLSLEEVLEQAKVMEKEQIMNAHENGQGVFDKHPHTQWTNDQAEQYYNETYGG